MPARGKERPASVPMDNLHAAASGTWSQQPSPGAHGQVRIACVLPGASHPAKQLTKFICLVVVYQQPRAHSNAWSLAHEAKMPGVGYQSPLCVNKAVWARPEFDYHSGMPLCNPIVRS
jgi:hypothetical protein